MSERRSPICDIEGLSRDERVEQICDSFERQWQQGSRPSIEDFLERLPSRDQSPLLAELIARDWMLRLNAGQPVDVDEFRRRFPAQQLLIDSIIESFGQPAAAGVRIEPTVDFRRDTSIPLSLRVTNDRELPEAIGRYRIVRCLGSGTFGVVYLAEDTQLDRSVALKVPRPSRFAGAPAIDGFLQEARNAARLNHPGIVRVYDVQREGDIVYVVQEYIAGADLARFMKTAPMPPQRVAELIVAVAEAVGYAHSQGIWHRDLKPANLLLDQDGQPHVADFGLALHESWQEGRAGEVAGTPAYMSPEQVRGEAHRLDGRSDIWSLGVILYELLTGQRPFRGTTMTQLLDDIQQRDPKPPRMTTPHVPRELERISLMCLAKRATDRYATAADLVDDLRHWLQEQAAGASNNRRGERRRNESGREGPAAIIPKGLRSFDASDADFFLELLPGPHDREGLPQSLRFWKTQIEQNDAEQTFSVGLLYGPSGCGKSSLIKAGLLPRLSARVLSVYVEATAADTEVRLIRALRKQFPEAPLEADLPALISHVRTTGAAQGRKTLLVIDQFEQWLLAHESSAGAELIAALRQCDASSVQCLVLVRDDFYASLNRFFQQLEVPLVEGHNSALVDRFDSEHARRVLISFGRSYGKLPEWPAEPDAKSLQFVQQVIRGLARDGRVVCVQLAVFAEMMKGRPWTEDSLRAVGGTDGVGENFLEETFSSPTAPPAHRVHQKAVRAVLRALLPEQGTDLKGVMKSAEALHKESGYIQRPADFAALLSILDHDVRLITPTDPEEPAPLDSTSQRARHYQLTHDFFVPSLRRWLTRKQKETRSGRAQIHLEERTQLWQLRRETKQLPSWSEWLQILMWARPSSALQRSLVWNATRYHVSRTALALVLVASGLVVAGEVHSFWQAKANVQQLATAEAEELPSIFLHLQHNRRYARPLLEQSFQAAAATPRQKLNVGLALADDDPQMLEASFQRLLDSDLTTSLIIRDQLAAHRRELTPRLWSLLDNDAGATTVRFRAALALAQYDPPQAANAQSWKNCADLVVRQLLTTVAGPPQEVSRVIAALAPARHALLPALVQALHDRVVAPQTVVALLTEYGRDQPETLCRAALLAPPSQFQQLLDALRGFQPQAVAWLKRDLTVPLASDATDAQRRQRGIQQVRAIVALTHFEGVDRLYEHLRQQPNPELRSRLVHELASLGVDWQIVAEGLRRPVDVSAQRALLLALGQYSLTPAQRDQLSPQVEQLFLHHPDSGLHSAAEWLLRSWHPADPLPAVSAEPGGHSPPPPRTWLINSEGQTLAVVDARQQVPLKRRFAIGTKEVSVQQFRRFRPQWQPREESAPTPDCPGNLISWFDAAAYCNWLSTREGRTESELCYHSVKGEWREYPDFAQRPGYRLPTVEEWKVATLAGAKTPYFFGTSHELLPEYAWVQMNSEGHMWPCGLLKPNDYGLFDVYGNGLEWCNDGDAESRKLMGGSVRATTLGTNPQEIGGYAPSVKYYSVSFRLAFTCPAEPEGK